MRCSKAKKLIERYVDSELDDVLTQDLRDHLSLCAACAGEESRARAMLGVMDQWSAVEPERTFETLLSRVEHSNDAARGQADREMPLPASVSFPASLLSPPSLSFPRRRESRSFGVPSWAAAVLATISIGAGVAAGISTHQDIVAATPPTEEQVVTAIGLKSFDDMLGASLVYGIEDNANGEEGGSL